MARLRISRSRPFFKYLLLVVILFCLYLIIVNAFFGHSNTNSSTIITAAIIGIIALFATYNERYAPVIEFDDENMYLSNKTSNEEVPLKQVTAIKLTSNRINNSHYWDISYCDNSDNNYIVQILPNIKNFKLFRERVKEKNPQAEIKDSIFF